MAESAEPQERRCSRHNLPLAAGITRLLVKSWFPVKWAIVRVMIKHWSGWVVAVIVLATFGVLGYEYSQAVSAFRSGRSPVAVAQATQERIFHAMANPWFFFAYLALLLALLFPVVRKIRKAGTDNDYWFLAALLVAIAALCRNFVTFH